MKTTRTPLILAIGVLAAGISSANGQNLISNASFEDPPLPTPNTYVFELPTDWNQNLDANSLPIIFNGTIPGWPSPEQGNQLLDIGNSSGNSAGVNQTFTVTVPGTYDLTWYDNAEIGEPHPHFRCPRGTPRSPPQGGGKHNLDQSTTLNNPKGGPPPYVCPN